MLRWLISNAIMIGLCIWMFQHFQFNLLSSSLADKYDILVTAFIAYIWGSFEATFLRSTNA